MIPVQSEIRKYVLLGLDKRVGLMVVFCLEQKFLTKYALPTPHSILYAPSPAVGFRLSLPPDRFGAVEKPMFFEA
jgi:hypothetical protein